MVEKSSSGLEEYPRWMADAARLGKRNSDAGAFAGMGLFTTWVT